MIAQGAVGGDHGGTRNKEVSARYLSGSPGPLFLSHFDRATTNYTILRGLRISDVGHWRTLEMGCWMLGGWLIDVGCCSHTPDTGGVGGLMNFLGIQK